MQPVLFPGTLFETPTYFALFMFAFLGIIILWTRRAKQWGLNPVRAVDFGFLAFVFGTIGGRLLHILVEAPDYYWEHPIRVFYFWQGGFVFYGGFFFAMFSLILVALKLKEPLGLWADSSVAPLFLGQGIGRMGCLSAGCCYGNKTDWWWGMVFTNPRSGAPLNVALHPTQALEAGFCFLMALTFWFAYRHPPKRRGEALVMGIVCYSVFRFFVEFLRGDDDRGVYFEGFLSTSQIISILGVVGCLIWWAWPRLRRVQKT